VDVINAMLNPEIKIVAENAAGTELCEFKKASFISFTRFLSSVGELTFVIPRTDPNFVHLVGLKTHLKVFRDGVLVWKGIYDYLREDMYTYTVFASTYESLLDYYLINPTAAATSTSRAFTTKKLGTEIAQILFNEAVAKTNSLLSGFTLGTVENPYTPGTTTEMTASYSFDYDKLSYVIRSLAKSGGADWKMGFDKTFNFYRRLGSDKAAIVFHIKDGEPSNIVDFKRDQDFRKIGNSIFAFGVGVKVNFLKSVKTDATSQTTHGLMERNLGMPKDLIDQAALDKLVDDQIQVTKLPTSVVAPSLIIKNVGFLTGWDVGDNVVIDLNIGQTALTEYKRVLGINAYYSQSGAETVHVYLGDKKV